MCIIISVKIVISKFGIYMVGCFIENMLTKNDRGYTLCIKNLNICYNLQREVNILEQVDNNRIQVNTQ